MNTSSTCIPYASDAQSTYPQFMIREPPSDAQLVVWPDQVRCAIADHDSLSHTTLPAANGSCVRRSRHNLLLSRGQLLSKHVDYGMRCVVYAVCVMWCVMCVAQVPCPVGSFCREGSTQPQVCNAFGYDVVCRIVSDVFCGAYTTHIACNADVSCFLDVQHHGNWLA
jgi:hypothetical protein